MWHHSLVVLLVFTTAFPTDVVQAAITKEKLKKIADDILAKIEHYGPIIIKLIAPFVAKKLVEIGITKITEMVGSQIGKRDVVEGETATAAAEKYLTTEFHSMIESLKDEFHARIDMEAVNGQIEDWQETLSKLATAAKDKIFKFIHQFGAFNFEGYVRTIIDKLISKRSMEKRSIRQTPALDTYFDEVLEELKQVLEKNFGGGN